MLADQAGKGWAVVQKSWPWLAGRPKKSPGPCFWSTRKTHDNITTEDPHTAFFTYLVKFCGLKQSKRNIRHSKVNFGQCMTPVHSSRSTGMMIVIWIVCKGNCLDMTWEGRQEQRTEAYKLLTGNEVGQDSKSLPRATRGEGDGRRTPAKTPHRCTRVPSLSALLMLPSLHMSPLPKPSICHHAWRGFLLMSGYQPAAVSHTNLCYAADYLQS